MKNLITQYLSPVLTSSLYVEINPVIKYFDQAVNKQLITAWNLPQQAGKLTRGEILTFGAAVRRQVLLLPQGQAARVNGVTPRINCSLLVLTTSRKFQQ